MAQVWVFEYNPVVHSINLLPTPIVAIARHRNPLSTVSYAFMKSQKMIPADRSIFNNTIGRNRFAMLCSSANVGDAVVTQSK